MSKQKTSPFLDLLAVYCTTSLQPPKPANTKTAAAHQVRWLLLCIGAFRQQHTVEKQPIT